MRTSTRGFTLIELMVVVAIIAILAAIAFPAYQRYGFRVRRTEGKDLGATVAAAEERYFNSFNSYTTDLGTLGIDPVSVRGYYSAGVALGGLDAQSCTGSIGSAATRFVVVVRPIGTQSQDACGSLLLDSLGVRCPANTNSAANSNGACW